MLTMCNVDAVHMCNRNNFWHIRWTQKWPTVDFPEKFSKCFA